MSALDYTRDRKGIIRIGIFEQRFFVFTQHTDFAQSVGHLLFKVGIEAELLATYNLGANNRAWVGPDCLLLGWT